LNRSDWSCARPSRRSRTRRSGSSPCRRTRESSAGGDRGARGAPVSLSAVYKLFTNPFYAGVRRYNLLHPLILSDEKGSNVLYSGAPKLTCSELAASASLGGQFVLDFQGKNELAIF